MRRPFVASSTTTSPWVSCARTPDVISFHESRLASRARIGYSLPLLRLDASTWTSRHPIFSYLGGHSGHSILCRIHVSLQSNSRLRLFLFLFLLSFMSALGRQNFGKLRQPHDFPSVGVWHRPGHVIGLLSLPSLTTAFFLLRNYATTRLSNCVGTGSATTRVIGLLLFHFLYPFLWHLSSQSECRVPWIRLLAANLFGQSNNERSFQMWSALAMP